MDALIFSCGTGGGHNSAANAIKQELLRRGHRVTMLDPYSLSNTRVGSLINQSYINLVKKAPRLFGLVYQLGNLYRRLPVHSPVYHINHRMALPVQRFLEEGNFDLIIMPHIFPGEILTNMRDHGICLPPTLLIATDYTCIPFTEEVQCDRYVIPSDDLCPAFTRWGIPKERLYPLGIPVDQSFENPPDKQESLRRLGLDPSLRYLLVVGKDKDQPRYQALAKSLNCEARVRFFGMQSETLPFYQMADGLLLPTLYDPFPNVILEAMACGLPVITTTGCGGAEFIVDGHNGYVCDALDIPALQQAVMALPARALGSAEGGHARERIMACTSERLSTQLLSLYQDLVK